MTTHLYCLVGRRGADVAASGMPAGIGGAPVRALELDAALAAWVSTLDARRSDASAPLALDDVVTHDAVIRAALARGETPLPARYAQRFAGDDACRAALRDRAPALAAALARVAGMVEMRIVAAPSERAVARAAPANERALPSGGAGRRYLEALRARSAATSAASDALASTLDRIARVVRPLARDEAPALVEKRGVASRAFLVEREVAERFRESAQREAAKSGGDVRVRVAGPGAPYSFGAIATD